MIWAGQSRLGDSAKTPPSLVSGAYTCLPVPHLPLLLCLLASRDEASLLFLREGLGWGWALLSGHPAVWPPSLSTLEAESVIGQPRSKRSSSAQTSDLTCLDVSVRTFQGHCTLGSVTPQTGSSFSSKPPPSPAWAAEGGPLLASCFHWAPHDVGHTLLQRAHHLGQGRGALGLYWGCFLSYACLVADTQGLTVSVHIPT